MSQNEYTHSEWSMTIPFKLVHVSARERLHACLRFKLVHVAENVQQRPLGSHISVGRRIRCNTGTLPVFPGFRWSGRRLVETPVVLLELYLVSVHSCPTWRLPSPFFLPRTPGSHLLNHLAEGGWARRYQRHGPISNQHPWHRHVLNSLQWEM